MSTHSFLTAAVTTVLVACSSVASAGPMRPQPQLRCPDGCGDVNGTGIYTAEGGSAGIGPERLMILRFINTPDAVRFDGLYRDEASGTWPWLTEVGTVYGADLGHLSSREPRYTVRAVRESRTSVTWTLVDAGGRSLNISNEDLRELVLFISFQLPGLGTRLYALDFSTVEIGARVSKYNLRWRDLTLDARPAQYCFEVAPSHPDVPAPPDQVVFQQGIDVDPDRGFVTRSSKITKDVTMSCFLGAPATVYGWGYGYGSDSDPFYFDAGIQMKRASYCADEQHYTVAHTPFTIADDQGANLPDHRIRPPAPLEAWWTPTGASCLNAPDGLRHPELVPSGGVGLTCAGQAGPLQPCQDPPTGSPYLGSGPRR